jgi:membrane protease YdiL (CAAX protease family)
VNPPRIPDARLTPLHPFASFFWLALAFALGFPSLLTWADFVLLARGGGQANLAQQLAYGLGKGVQFAWPLICVALWERRLPRPALPSLRGLEMGVLFGLLVAGGIFGLYFGILRDTPIFGATPERLRHKLEEFDLASPAGFALFAGFVIVPHSLLEEYYWRWFVFGQLRRRLTLPSAILHSSLGFMAHHVIVLAVFFPEQWFTAVLPFSLCLAVGGAVWAWLYERSGSLYAPWLSHLLIDAALFGVGYDLFFIRGR